MNKRAPLMMLVLGFVFLIALSPSTAFSRCGYYAGYGYRCFGDQGGTGGKVFKEMDENTQRCGYWNPGCRKSGEKTGNYQSPKSDRSYRSPRASPGYTRPGTR